MNSSYNLYYCEGDRMHVLHQEWLDSYLMNGRNMNLSKNTSIGYRSDLSKFITWYETYYTGLLDLVSPKIISAYMGSMKSLSLSTKRRNMSSIKYFFEYLIQIEVDDFDRNPVRNKIHSVKVNQNDIRVYPIVTEKDWEAIRISLRRPKDKLIAHILYYLGLRINEVCQIQVSNFNKIDGTLRLHRKGGKVHIMKMEEASLICFLMEDFLKTRRYSESDFLFSNRLGKGVTSRLMHQIIKRFLVESECEDRGLSAHSFRRTCASNLYRRTKDIMFVREYLNHSDINTTQLYIDIS